MKIISYITKLKRKFARKLSTEKYLKTDLHKGKFKFKFLKIPGDQPCWEFSTRYNHTDHGSANCLQIRKKKQKEDSESFIRKKHIF